MKFFQKRTKKELSRREVVASRREEAAREDLSPSASAYRRSRTLTAAGREAEELSMRQQGRATSAKRRKIVSWVGGAVVCLGLVLFLFSQLTLGVTVAGSPDRLSQDDSDRYAALLDEYLSMRPLERLRFAINHTSLQAFFSEHAPEVRSVDVSGSLGLTKSELQLIFRQPTIQWSSGDSIYFVDDMGVTFEKKLF